MDIESIVSKAVDEIKVIDVHSHLFPDDHDELFLFGFDNLMTYHYLIAELFMVWEGKSKDEFFSLTKIPLYVGSLDVPALTEKRPSCKRFAVQLRVYVI